MTYNITYYNLFYLVGILPLNKFCVWTGVGAIK